MYSLRYLLLNICPNPKMVSTSNEDRVNSEAIPYEYPAVYQAGTMAGAGWREVGCGNSRCELLLSSYCVLL